MPATTTETVELDPDYRDRLDEIAREQYVAEAENEFKRARDLREELFDEMWAVGSGAGRVVIAIPETEVDGPRDAYVAKLAVPNHDPNWGGLEQNRREAELWEERGGRFLVPVVDSHPDDYWLVMPRGSEVARPDNTFYKWKREAEYALRDDVWGNDVEVENVVTLDGEFRLCDYGVPPEHGD